MGGGDLVALLSSRHTGAAGLRVRRLEVHLDLPTASRMLQITLEEDSGIVFCSSERVGCSRSFPMLGRGAAGTAAGSTEAGEFTLASATTIAHVIVLLNL